MELQLEILTISLLVIINGDTKLVKNFIGSGSVLFNQINIEIKK